MITEEFKAENNYSYNTQKPLAWVLSHIFRYKSFPILVLVAACVNNYAFSYIKLCVGKAFDVLTSTSFRVNHLLPVVGAIIIAALVQTITGLMRNVLVEFLAQRTERDSRDEFYASMLKKNQSFFGRQNTGDIMARATGDVRSLNLMISPGIMLILDSFTALIIPIILIGFIHPQLLMVPAFFIVFLTFTLWDYNNKLKPVTMNQREEFGKMNTIISETMGGIEVVKATVQEKYEWNKFIATTLGLISVGCLSWFFNYFRQMYSA